LLHIRAPHFAVCLIVATVLSGCGGSNSPSGPSGTPPVLSGIAPNSGTTLGGTVVTITGSNLASAVTVSIGGTAATGVSVSGSTITATTAAHASGVVDVVVTSNGQTGRLTGGFTYKAPAQTTNAPPVVKSIVAKGTRPNEPAQFADLDDEITVTANVEDGETPISQLTFEWTAPAGTFTGQGASVTWKAPAQFTTPAPITVSLVVTEKYQTTDDSGLPVDKENKVTSSSIVHLHDSESEVGGMARQFLLDFSDSSIPPSVVLRNFTPNCPGTKDELKDVTDNRNDFLILSSSIGGAQTTIGFGGHCPNGNVAGDACAEIPSKWVSRVLKNGDTRTDNGTDQVTAVYEKDQWRLCDSRWLGTCTGSGCDSIRGFVPFLR
jgi:IPT/TIG domain.